jgi:eukaryotic-like serine/threonine-protein kinase
LPSAISDLAESSIEGKTTSDDETRQLLQSRLWLVFSVLAGIGFFYSLSPLFYSLFLPVSESTTRPSVLVTFGIAVANAGFALRCRLGKRGLGELRLLDALSMLLTCWVMAVSFNRVRPAGEAALSLQLGLTWVLLARAILLPSSGRRTFVLCVLALLPAGFIGTELRLEALGRAARPGETLSEAFLASRNLALTAFLATLTSNVIYGLRRQVRASARIGQYLLREKIGEGGMGVVYRATHALLRRDTALKLLLPSRIGGENLVRFEREVKLTASLTHPNTVAVYDYGRTPEGIFYYAMEHLDGGDLEQLVGYAGPLGPGRVIWILEQVCRALGEAHALGLIHRDIKPANILVCERGREPDVAKVVDFGLVKDLNLGADAALTQRETLAGTPLYMAPEAIRSPESLDARADLYSLGAVAYFLLVGRPVFAANTLVEVCAAHLHTPPTAPSVLSSEVAPELDAIVLRCLEKDPAARFGDAAALLAALRVCPGRDQWSVERAGEWWREHGARFRLHAAAGRKARFDTAPALGSETDGRVRIDLETRSQPA